MRSRLARAAGAGLSLVVFLGLASCGSPEGAPQSLEERVRFEGVEYLSESVLFDLIRRDLERYTEDPRLPALDDAVFRIAYRYRLEGFDHVEVTSRVVAEYIIFHVQENSRIVLGRVDFLGATVFREDELRLLVPGGFLGEEPPYSLRLAILIGEGILAAYRDRGYVDASVEREVATEFGVKDRVRVFYAINEGKPYTVSELRGPPGEPDLARITQEFLAKPYTLSTSERLEAAIVDYYREHGHPFSTARARPVLDRETGTVAIDVEMHAGPRLRVGRTEINGSGWTRDSFIRSRADLEGEPEYKGSDLRRAEERLMATNIFKRVRVSPGDVEDDPGRVPLQIEVEEREIWEASIRAGYGSFERVRVGADLSVSNVAGGAETIRVGGSISSAGYRGEVELGVPYLLATELRLGVSGYLESRKYPSFDANARGGVVSLSYPVAESFTATVGVRRANIITTNVQPSVPPGDLLDFDYTAVFLRPTLDLRDNPLVPTRGIFLTTEMSWSPSLALSDVQFWSATGRFSFYVPLPWGLVFASSLQGGLIYPLGSTVEVPISLRYFAGGTNTVRGFRFESIGPQASGAPTGGEVFLSAQSEVRFPILGDLQGAVFADQGGVWFAREQVTFSELRYAVGLGLRYVTPAGALVADLGWNPDRRAGEHTVEFHLSVGFPF